MRALSESETTRLKSLYSSTNSAPFETVRFSRTSKRVFSWCCAVGHVWDTPVYNVLRAETPCPVCGGRVPLPGVNDLATVFSDLMREWDYEENARLPEMFLPASNLKAHWVCAQGHKWVTAIANRTQGGKGCPVCSGNVVVSGFNDLASQRPDLLRFWDYEANAVTPDSVAPRTRTLLHWRCPVGHKWVASTHSGAVSCPVCGNRVVLRGFNDLATTRPDVAAEWDYEANAGFTPEEVTYGSDRKAHWVCAQGHKWVARVSNRSYSGCPVCALNNRSSKGEEELIAYLQDELQLKVQPHDRSIIPGKEIDAYLPDHRIGVEFNGVYWHSDANPARDSRYHEDKWATAKEAGVQLIQIWEDEWNSNPGLVKRMLAHKLGVDNSPRVFARNTVVREVPPAETDAFLTANHIQGPTQGGVRVGLYTKVGKLVALAVFKREPGDANALNLLRFATSATVVGGFTKLLTYVERRHTPTKIVTFSDHCVSDGSLYANNGFKAVKELAPDYMYVTRGQRHHKFGYRLQRFRTDPDLTYREGLTESQLAKLNGLHRIWDAGKTKWERENDMIGQP